VISRILTFLSRFTMILSPNKGIKIFGKQFIIFFTPVRTALN